MHEACRLTSFRINHLQGFARWYVSCYLYGRYTVVLKRSHAMIVWDVRERALVEWPDWGMVWIVALTLLSLGLLFGLPLVAFKLLGVA